MRYFKKEDFDKCMEFLADKPDTVETQQELYKFMHEECHIMPEWIQATVKNMAVYSRIYATVKNMAVYSRIYATRFTPKTANWCCTMSDGSQVVWNRKYQEFYTIDAVGMEHCDYLNYLSMFTELKDINPWLLENWSNWLFRETQKQLFAIWNGKYDENFKNYWR